MTKRAGVRHVAFATALLLVAAGSAHAQGPEGATATPPRPTAQGSPAGTFINIRRPDQWTATGLKAKNVYDPSDNKIGAINDLVIDRDGRVVVVVIGVGGFLGIGEKNVGVPFQDVKISMRNGDEWLILDRSKDDLKAAPAFTAAGTMPAAQQAAENPDRSFGTLNPSQDAAKPAPASDTSAK